LGEQTETRFLAEVLRRTSCSRLLSRSRSARSSSDGIQSAGTELAAAELSEHAGVDRVGPASERGDVLDLARVCHLDRRGRGESRDAERYDVARELDDLEALIEAAGGSAHVYGISSGAALALDAAARGARIESLVVHDAPFIVDSREPIPADYADRLERLLADGRRGDAVRSFMRQVGAPRIVVSLMRFMPSWSKLEASMQRRSHRSSRSSSAARRVGR
jgi:pimeloyl-ACP methyl ester carboxylesterase